jgi:hypothetical protein
MKSPPSFCAAAADSEYWLVRMKNGNVQRNDTIAIAIIFKSTT